jgi:nicotinamidase-related amidase
MVAYTFWMSTFGTPTLDAAALITIDVQMDTLDGAPLEIAGTSAALPRLTRLSQAFRASGRPIVHVVRIYRADGSNAEPIRKHLVTGAVPVLRAGTPGRQLAPGLTSDPDTSLDDELLLSGRAQHLGPSEIVMYKPRWGAFYATTLDDHLRALRVDTVVVAGCNYPNCPRTSIYEASERDYRVVLVDDAVSGLYERGRTEMANIGVSLMETDTVISALQQCAAD